MQQTRTSPQAPAAPAPPPDLGAQIRQQVREQVAAAREQAQQTRAQTGVAVAPIGPLDNVIPPQAVDIATAFFVMIAVIVVGYPLARAVARWIERRGQAPAIPPGMGDQLQRIEHSVDAMAIEIERISEAQRYMARLQTERAEPAALPPRQAAS